MSNPLQHVHLDELARLSGDVIYLTDAGGRITFVTETVRALFGYDSGSLEGSHYSSLLAPQARKEAYRLYSEQIQNATPRTYLELASTTSQGTEIWIGQSATPLLEDGVVRGLRVVARDISERRRLARHTQHAVTQMRLLHEITLSRGGASERLGFALSRAMDQLGLPLGFAGRTSGAEIEIVQYMPEDSGMLEGQGLPLDRSWAGLVVQRNEVVAVDGVGAHPDSREDSLGTQAFIGAPIRVGESTVGVLGFASMESRPGGFSSSDKEFVTLLADWWGGLVAHAGLTEQAALLDHRIQAIADATSDGVVSTDPKGCIISLNAKGQELLGVRRRVTGEDVRLFFPSFLKIAGSRGGIAPGVCADGTQFQAELVVATTGAGTGGGLIGVFRDFTQAEKSVSRFERSQATLNAIFEGGPYVMGVVSQRNYQVVHLSANSLAIEVFGLLKPASTDPRGGVAGLLPSALLWEAACGRCLAHRKPTVFELRLGRRQFEMTLNLIEDRGGESPRFSYTGQDVTDSAARSRELEEATLKISSLQQEAEGHRARRANDRVTADGLSQRVALQGSLDSLTNLLNRGGFEEAVRRAMARRENEGQSYWVVLLNVDGFQGFNESLGRAGADELLEQLAGRLRLVVADENPIARVDGNEFAILLTDAGSEHRTRRMVAEIRAAVEDPHRIADRDVRCTVCMGVVLGESGHQKAADVLGDADIALAEARRTGRGATSFLTSAMRDRLAQRLNLESGLRKVMAAQEMEVYYQAIVSLEDGHVVGFEASLRWHHAERGTLTKETFSSAEQEPSLSADLDELLLDHSAMQLAYWREAYPKHPDLAIYVQSHGTGAGLFRDAASTACERHGLPVGSLATMMPAGTRPGPDGARVWPVPVGSPVDGLPPSGIQVDQRLLRAFYDLANGLGVSQMATDVASVEQLTVGYRLPSRSRRAIFAPSHRV